MREIVCLALLFGAAGSAIADTQLQGVQPPSFTFTPHFDFSMTPTPTLTLAPPSETVARTSTDDTTKPSSDAAKKADANGPAWANNVHMTGKLDAKDGAGKGATFGASTADGQTSITSGIAVWYDLPITIFNPDLGWTPSVAAQWTKDNSTKTKVDGRLIRFGANGTLPAPVDSLGLLATFNVDGVDDNVMKQRSVGFRANTTPVWYKVLRNGRPYTEEPEIAYTIYPTIGTQLDRVTYAKTPNSAGNAAGFNGRIDADFYPNGIFWRLHFFTTFVRARDVYSSADLQKRSATYYDFGVEWVLTHPKGDGKDVTPALSLHRIIGENFLDGTSRSVKTMLVLTLKVN
jgi:hypothetical protein